MTARCTPAARRLCLQPKECAVPTSESEAKFKFCPLLKTSDDKMKMCQGTMCMMWRWADDARQHGYCGLAPLAAPGA
jgi:hypothetical protein